MNRAFTILLYDTDDNYDVTDVARALSEMRLQFSERRVTEVPFALVEPIVEYTLDKELT